MSRITTYTETVTLQELHCAECGILFAAPAQWLETKSQTKGSFYCPNGHILTYGVSENARLREQVQKEQARTNRLEAQLTHAHDQLKAAEKELARHKKRTANGVCPCCNRSFVQLQQHMKTKHPEYTKEKNLVLAE